MGGPAADAGAPTRGSRGRRAAPRGVSAAPRGTGRLGGDRGSDGPSHRQCLTVPGGPGTPPRLFAFSLSRCSWDEPRGSFECARLAVPRLGQSRLDSLGSIQEKITVCAWESVYPPPRERVSPKKEPCSRAVVEPDPAVLGYGKGTAAPEVGVTGLLGKGSVCHIRVPTPASPRASLQSLVQPRALQPHRKHKLLQRLEETPVGSPGGTRLLATLEEVAELDPAACFYRGKGILAGRAREDWPGNTAQERQQAAPLQRRSQDCRPSTPSFLVPLQQPPEHGSPQATGRNLLGVKRLALLDFSDPRAIKRHRSCPQMLSTQRPGARGQQQVGALPPSSQAGELESPESEEEMGDDWEESAPSLEQHLSVPRGEGLPGEGGQGHSPGVHGPVSLCGKSWTRPQGALGGDAGSQASSSSVAEIPDYLRKYHTICSAEQRRAYEAAFSADYTEYRDLHARIANVSRKFIQLGAKMKTLKQGTKERKALEATILHEYSHFKKTYPSYQQEKNRCEYLHQKLSHIKSLILEFEGSGNS